MKNKKTILRILTEQIYTLKKKKPPMETKLHILRCFFSGDFLENVYKIIIKKPSLYSFPEDLIKK